PLFIKIIIVQFYFWAGFLKLNQDWLSGASLYHPLWLIPSSLLPAALRYGIVLELVLAWGLLARDRRIFWPVWAQLVAFHLISAPIVGFFYPILMAFFLAYFAAARFDAPLAGPRRAGIAILAVFVALQFLPRLLSRDPALTGEGRTFALHMFDGRIECRGGLLLKLPSGERLTWQTPRTD